MILRKLIREQIALYFESEQWTGALEIMSRGGRFDVRHAHIYTNSILHPASIRSVVEAYFAAKGIPVERKIGLVSVGRGQLVVYYIQPEGMCHFEIFPRFSQDAVLEPMEGQFARGGLAFECWDTAFMENYYKQFEFTAMGEAEEAAVRDYFRSDAWEQIYAVMYYESERRVHCHAIIETSLHPEEILPLGQAAIEARGWEVDRGVSVVFGVDGYEQGKLTLAEAGGLDAAKIPEALGSGYAGSLLLERLYPRMVARDFEPAAHASIALKDLKMIGALTESLDVPAPMSKQAASLYQILTSKGHAELDLISILKVIDPKERL